MPLFSVLTKASLSRTITWFSLLPGLCLAFPQNPVLAGIPETSFLALPKANSLNNAFSDGKILDFSGMTYDFHRHKIIAFGGGHATAVYPSAVTEFDFTTLGWSYLVNHVDCKLAYTVQNVLYCEDGGPSGGFTYGGKSYCGSRHTYDGLEMAFDTCLMICGQSQEFGGCNGIDSGASDYYLGKAGLFLLNPVTGNWTVSRSSVLAKGYSFTAVNPGEPDMIYIGSAYGGKFDAVNYKTETVVPKRSVPSLSAGSDMSMTYCPDRNSFFAFPKKSVYEYAIGADTWTKLTPAGTVPDCYSINVVWDTLNRVFCCFYGNRFHYYSPSENRWYTAGDSLPMTRLYHHHIYDPVNNIHLAVGYGWNTYAFKFTDTTGKFPGTAGASRIERRSFNPASAAIHASPNPFKATIEIRCVIAENEPSRLHIIGTDGRLVRDLTRDLLRTPHTPPCWDGRDMAGRSVAPGLYIARLSTPRTDIARTLILSR